MVAKMAAGYVSNGLKLDTPCTYEVHPGDVHCVKLLASVVVIVSAYSPLCDCIRRFSLLAFDTLDRTLSDER